MGIGIFKRRYTIRQYEPQEIVRGLAVAAYTDKKVRLNVQPLSPDELAAVPEGESTVKRLKTFGDDALTSADAFTGRPGDRLFYLGCWYECKSSVMWAHTGILNHYRSEFVLLEEQEESPEEEVQP